MTQVTNDQVSFGSQPQYRPHAASAHTAPAMTAKVHTGNAKALTRSAARSSAAADGSREGRSGKRRSRHSRHRYSAVMTKPTMKMPDADIAPTTWILIQYEFSAGTSGAAGAYRTVPASPR